MAKKAVVLAAGLGTRLRPLTCSVPKPLMPVWGEPMLARIVGMLRGWGVEDIVVNCHYLHEQVEAWCAANGCRASYEPKILGTGGVAKALRIAAVAFNVQLQPHQLLEVQIVEKPQPLQHPLQQKQGEGGQRVQ